MCLDTDLCIFIKLIYWVYVEYIMRIADGFVVENTDGILTYNGHDKKIANC